MKTSYKKNYKQFGEQGTAFDMLPTEDASRIARVEVRCGAVIDAVGLTYDAGAAQWQGGSGGGPKGFTLEQDEYIKRVGGRYAVWCGYKYLTTLEFETTKGKTYKFGGGGGESFSYEVSNGYVLGLCGCAHYNPRNRQSYLSDLGIYYVEEKSFGLPGIPGMR